MSTPENRIRLIIEADNSSARQGFRETEQDLDSLAAKGRGLDLGGALRLDAGAVTQPAAKVEAALEDVGAKGKKAGEDAGAGMATARDAINKVGVEADNSGKTGRTAMRNLGSGAAEAKAQAEALGANLGEIRALAAQLAPVLVAAFGVDQVISFANQVISAAMAMEQLGATYQAVFKDGGAEQLRYAAGMADAFGKSLLDVAGAYKKFAAAAEAVGLSTDNQRRTFEAVTAAITKVGGSSQDVSGALLALEQMLSKGTVQAEEYRQQFAERIPGALKMGADALGVTTAAFQKMMENGEVISNDFIPKLTTQLEKFGDGWQATADTATANGERLKNSFLELSNSSALTGLVTFTEKIGTAFNKNLTHNLEQFTVTYRAMMAEAKGDLSPFATWSNSLEGLKVQLDALDQRKSTYIKDLKDQARGLADALVNVQSHQVDFGPSGETVDQLRAKLKWFQDQITALTGQTWVVNVVAQVDNSQLVQAKSYIQDLIKGTAEYKTRSLETKQDALDNAVNVVTSNKTTVETKLANPNLDLREADALSRELENLNGQLADANLGYRELAKERKKLGEQQIKDNGAVTQFNESRGGISESDLSKATQASDAHALSIARQVDAYAELKKGLIDGSAYYEKVRRVQEAENTTIEKINKSGERGAKALAAQALAAERYGEGASAYYDNIIASLDQLQDSLTGGVEKNANRTDKWFEQQFDAIRQKVVGAKGDVSQYAAAWVALDHAWPGDHILAVTKDIISALKQQAQLLQDIAQATGDPAMMYEAQRKAAEAWYKEKKVLIESSAADEATKAKELAALQQGYDAKLIEAKSNAYKDVAAVSSQYWDAEKERLTKHLEVVKANADDETSYRIYAAQQWDDYNRKLLENQAAYAGSFAETLSAKWALAYGSYKSEATRTKETWDQTADGIIKTTDGIIDGVASGAGDMVRAWEDGTGSIEDLMRNLKSSVLDIFASMIEELLKMWLKDFVGGLGSSTGSGSSLLGALTSGLGGGTATPASAAGSLDLSKLTSLGDSIGRGAGDSLVDSLATGSSDLSMVIGDAPDIGKSIGKALTQYGDVYNAGSSTYAAGANQTWSAGSFTSAVQKGTESGWKSVLGNTAVGAGIGSLFNSGNSMTGTIGGALGSLAGSGLSTMLGLAGSTLGSLLGPIGGALGGLLGGLLGGSSSVTEKTGSGYKISVNAGTVNMSGVDFYKTTTSGMFGSSSTSHSTLDTGMVDPDVARQVQDALDKISENLKDFAKTLGFTADILDSFTFPEMTLTSDQLDSYIRNVGNAMAFTALEAAGLRGVFDAFAKKYEAYSDEFERLSTAFGVVGGYTEAFGYDLSALANITDEQLATLREAATSTAEGTASATLAMASSMGATSEELASLTASATDAGEAVQATDEQLRRIAEADYASQLIDAVGGEDEFKTAMERLVKHTMSSLDQYASNLGYYTKKAGEYIGSLSETGVSLDNFWQRFDAAMHGPLTADQFEAWNDAAKWVDALNTIEGALASWGGATTKVAQDLDVRSLKAQGQNRQAEATELLIDQEWELAAAREAGYDATLLARVQEVQARERSALAAQQEIERLTKLEDAQERYYTAIGDDTALLNLRLKQNERELADVVQDYGYEVADALRQAMEAETRKEIADKAKTLALAKEQNRLDIASRTAAIEGRQVEADALSKVASYISEIQSAMESGLDESELAELREIQRRELEKFLDTEIDALKAKLADLLDAQQASTDARAGVITNAWDELQTKLEKYAAGQRDLQDDIITMARDAAEAFRDLGKSLRETILDLGIGDTATGGLGSRMTNAQAAWEDVLARGMAGDQNALAQAGEIGRQYVELAQQGSGSSGAYQTVYDSVRSGLSQLARYSEGMGGQFDDVGDDVSDDAINDARKRLAEAEAAKAQAQYELLKGQAAEAFKNSWEGQIVQGLANTGAGWGAMGSLWAVMGHTQGMRYLDYLRSGGESTDQFLGWYQREYGAGSGYVDWSAAMSQWMSNGVWSLPGGAGSLYEQSQAAYQDWQDKLAAIPGYADGGISRGPQLAWVSEWAPDAEEAHIPLPSGGRVPVSITSVGSGGSPGDTSRIETLLTRLVALMESGNGETSKKLAAVADNTRRGYQSIDAMRRPGNALAVVVTQGGTQ